MTKSTTKPRCNGDRIATLRLQQGLTQDILAQKSAVDIRTVQRAEKGNAVSLETLASLAATLKVTVPDLVQSDAAELAETGDAELNTVVLKPIASGMTLLNMICASFAGRVECQSDPTPDNIENLGAVVETIEKYMPDPWQSPFDVSDSLNLAQRLRQAVILSEQLAKLHAQGVTLFAGTYTGSAQIPYWDMDEGHMTTGRRQAAQPVTICRLILGPTGLGRVVLQVTDQWKDPAPAKVIEDAPFGDEIPF